MPRSVRIATGVLVAVVMCLGPTGCGDDDSPTVQDPVERQVEIYTTVLRAVVSEADPSLDEAGPPVVFVAARGDDPINIDVQAAVVVELEGWSTIRFVDDIDEAVDLADPEGAVRDDGMLVGLGPVPEEGRAVSVYADRYESPARTVVFDVSLQRTPSGWVITGQLDGVPVATPQ